MSRQQRQESLGWVFLGLFLASFACLYILAFFDQQPTVMKALCFALLTTALYLRGHLSNSGAWGWVMVQIVFLVGTILELRQRPEAVPPGLLGIPYVLIPCFYIAGVVLLVRHWLMGRRRVAQMPSD